MFYSIFLLSICLVAIYVLPRAKKGFRSNFVCGVAFYAGLACLTTLIYSSNEYKNSYKITPTTQDFVKLETPHGKVIHCNKSEIQEQIK